MALALSSARIGSYVDRLNIDVRSYNYVGVRPSEEASTRELVAFLATLTNLLELRLTGTLTTVFAKAVLTGKTHGSLPNMRSLYFQDPLDSWMEPFEWQHFVKLNRYPKLEDLTIGYNRNEDEEFDQADFFRHDAPNTTIKKLTLLGNLEIDDSKRVSHFLRQFHALNSIKVDTLYEFKYLDLAAVGATLLHLAVNNWSDQDDQDDNEILNEVLPLLPNLLTLKLGYNTCSEATFTVLLSCPSIETLHFNEDCKIFWRDGLKRILTGPRRMAGLRRLTIDTEAGKRGTQMPSEIACAPGRECADFEGGWTLPGWFGEFTYSEAKELEEIKDSLMIEVTGTMFDAIEVEECYEDELERINELRKSRELPEVHYL